MAAKTRTVTGVLNNRLRACGNPNMFTFTHKLPARTQVQVEVTAGASDILVRLAMHGRMIYAQKCTPDPVHMIQPAVGYMPVPGAQCAPQQGWCGVPPQPSFTAYPQGPNGIVQAPILGPGYGAISPVPQYPLNGWRR